MTPTKLRPYVKPSVKTRTGCYDLVETIGRGIYARPAETGFYIWSKHCSLKILINGNLLVRLYSEEWEKGLQTHSEQIMSSPTREFPPDVWNPNPSNNGLSSSINQIADEMLCKLVNMEDPYIYRSADIRANKIRKLIYRAIQEKLRLTMIWANIDLNEPLSADPRAQATPKEQIP